MQAATTTFEPRQFAGLVRRFCGCDFVRVCHCGLPQTRSGWTVGALSRLKLEMQEHGSLQRAAETLGESRQRCNIALDALLGRTPTHALAALEAKAAKS